MHHPKLCLLVLIALAACSRSGGSGFVPTLAFGAPVFFPHGGSSGVEPMLADIDADGVVDIALLAGGDLAFLKGFGTSFGAPRSSPHSGEGIVASLGDLNGDRRLDAVVWNHSLPGQPVVRQLSVHLGDGTGGFTLGLSTNLSLDLRDVVVADLDGDGFADAALAAAFDDQILVMRGNGAGGFTRTDGIPLDDPPGQLVAADFDADGRLDLATSTGTHAVVLRQQAGGTFAAPVSTPVAGGTRQLAAGDLDGNRFADLVLLTNVGSEAVPLLGNGQGSFAAQAIARLPDEATFWADPLLSDLDVDGQLDLVVATGNRIVVAYGIAGGFGPFETVMSGADAVNGLALADLDSDSYVDITFVRGLDQVGVLRNPKQRPTGVAVFGTGTPGCGGAMTLAVSGAPTLGNVDFRFVGADSPRSTFGFLLLGGPRDEPGTLFFNFGFRVHIVLTFAIQETWFSDAAGCAYLRKPIPANPSLAGLEVIAQALWLERAPVCTPSSIGVASSRGLAVTLQP